MRGWERLKSINSVSGKSGEAHSDRTAAVRGRPLSAGPVVANGTPPRTPERRQAFTSLFATSAIACFTYAVLTIIVLHVLRPEYAPASHMISDYGVGSYGSGS